MNILNIGKVGLAKLFGYTDQKLHSLQAGYAPLERQMIDTSVALVVNPKNPKWHFKKILLRAKLMAMNTRMQELGCEGFPSRI